MSEHSTSVTRGMDCVGDLHSRLSVCVDVLFTCNIGYVWVGKCGGDVSSWDLSRKWQGFLRLRKSVVGSRSPALARLIGSCRLAQPVLQDVACVAAMFVRLVSFPAWM